ncbi:MAG: hypothetical protein J0J10_23160 [Bosea sp.]|uniref:HI1506-related protein n=1 Tax=Bosea sp. (in: a-proteobacteria) TaxID=1871050 RepID=UPI001ACB0B91|nr:HI1506-related protein [Bosea sp. (in: a-proteobacteria)]MBN9471672.1 hypothetical protein [Bosea sp. (in: a-proteobacteria)]
MTKSRTAPADAPAADPQPEQPTISRFGLPETIIITSRVDGFRRAGLAHPAQPVSHRTADFTDEQLLQLGNEPNLVIVPKAD